MFNLSHNELIFLAMMAGLVALCFIVGWLSSDLLDWIHRKTLKW